MQRNLDFRVEVYTPIYDPDLQKQLKTVIEFGLKDNVKARIVDGSGENKINGLNIEIPFRSQEELYKLYKKEYETGFVESEKSDITNNIQK
jgi:polyphosphate kinase